MYFVTDRPKAAPARTAHQHRHGREMIIASIFIVGGSSSPAALTHWVLSRNERSQASSLMCDDDFHSTAGI